MDNLVTKEDVSIRQVLPTGAICVYTMINGYFVERQYQGYGVDEAIDHFLETVNSGH